MGDTLHWLKQENLLKISKQAVIGFILYEIKQNNAILLIKKSIFCNIHHRKFQLQLHFRRYVCQKALSIKKKRQSDKQISLMTDYFQTYIKKKIMRFLYTCLNSTFYETKITARKWACYTNILFLSQNTWQFPEVMRHRFDWCNSYF